MTTMMRVNQCLQQGGVKRSCRFFDWGLCSPTRSACFCVSVSTSLGLIRSVQELEKSAWPPRPWPARMLSQAARIRAVS